MKTKIMTVIQKIRYPITMLSTMFMSVMLNTSMAFADGSSSSGGNSSGGKTPDFSGAATPVVQLINSLLGPVISVVVAVGAIYCIILGVKLAKADEPQEREKAKMALKNAIIGFFLIFILIVVMRLMVPQLIGWVNSNRGDNTEVTIVQ